MKKLLIIIVIFLSALKAESQVVNVFDNQGTINFNFYTMLDSLYYYYMTHETISRTIYVAITGNDDTGSGLIGNPFATIPRALQDVAAFINPNVVITINLAAGNYAYDDEEILKEMTRIITLSSGELDFTCEMVQVYSGLTLTPRSPESYIYDVTGVTFTDNELQGKFLLSGSNYIPIATNNTTTINSIPGNSAATSVYEPGVTFTSTGGNIDINLKGTEATSNLKFYYIKFIYSGSIGLTNQNIATNFISCVFSGTKFTFENYSKFNITRCSFVTSSDGVYANIGEFNYVDCSIIKTGMRGGVGIFNSYQWTGSAGYQRSFGSMYIHNFSYGIILGLGYYSTKNSNNLIINATYTFTIRENAFFAQQSVSSTLYILNSTYLLYYAANGGDLPKYNFGFYVTSLVGTPTNFIAEAMQPYGYVNDQRNISIIIPGLYSEKELSVNTTFPDNSSGTISVGNITQNRAIYIDYEIDRSTSKEMGTIMMTNKADTDIIDNDEFNDTGVTFTKSLVGNVITLGWATTSTGSAATFKYQIRRIMI